MIYSHIHKHNSGLPVILKKQKKTITRNHQENVTVGQSIWLPEEAPYSHQQECPLLLLFSNHHHIPAAWHRLGSHGNHTTRLPLPLVSWQQADEMRQWYCVSGCVYVYVCVSRNNHMLARILGSTQKHLFAFTAIIDFLITPCCNNPDTRLVVY